MWMNWQWMLSGTHGALVWENPSWRYWICDTLSSSWTGSDLPWKPLVLPQLGGPSSGSSAQNPLPIYLSTRRHTLRPTWNTASSALTGPSPTFTSTQPENTLLMVHPLQSLRRWTTKCSIFSLPEAPAWQESCLTFCIPWAEHTHSLNNKKLGLWKRITRCYFNLKLPLYT